MSADGNWKTTINSPMGVQEGTLSITTSGDSFSGKMEGRQGAQDISGKVDGNTLTWSASITQPFPITLEFTVSVDGDQRSEEHTSELQSRQYLVCRLLLEKKKQKHSDVLHSVHTVLIILGIQH